MIQYKGMLQFLWTLKVTTTYKWIKKKAEENVAN